MTLETEGFTSPAALGPRFGTFTCSVTKDASGAPVRIKYRRVRKARLIAVTGVAPMLLAERKMTNDERAEYMARLSPGMVAERALQMAAMWDAVIIAAAVEPRFTDRDDPADGEAHIELLDDDDKAMLTDAVLTLSGMIAKEGGETEGLASFPADAGRGSGGTDAGEAGGAA